MLVIFAVSLFQSCHWILLSFLQLWKQCRENCHGYQKSYFGILLLRFWKVFCRLWWFQTATSIQIWCWLENHQSKVGTNYANFYFLYIFFSPNCHFWLVVLIFWQWFIILGCISSHINHNVRAISGLLSWCNTTLFIHLCSCVKCSGIKESNGSHLSQHKDIIFKFYFCFVGPLKPLA